MKQTQAEQVNLKNIKTETTKIRFYLFFVVFLYLFVSFFILKQICPSNWLGFMEPGLTKIELELAVPRFCS